MEAGARAVNVPPNVRPKVPSRLKNVTSYIAAMIALDMLPYNFVSGRGFKRLMGYLVPGYTIPHRTTFSRTRIPKMYDELKQALRDRLQHEMTSGEFRKFQHFQDIMHGSALILLILVMYFSRYSLYLQINR